MTRCHVPNDPSHDPFHLLQGRTHERYPFKVCAGANVMGRIDPSSTRVTDHQHVDRDRALLDFRHVAMRRIVSAKAQQPWLAAEAVAPGPTAQR